MTNRLRERSTPDLIVIYLTMIVGFVVIAITLVAVGGLVTGHTHSVTEVLKSVGELTNGLIALIVGYVGGRGAAAFNGNGKSGNPVVPNGDGWKPPLPPPPPPDVK